jgi:hypothetical protein
MKEKPGSCKALPADLRGPEEEEIFHKQPGRSRIEIMSPLIAHNHLMIRFDKNLY